MAKTYRNGSTKETVYVDQEGNGIFYCNGGSVSVLLSPQHEKACAIFCP